MIPRPAACARALAAAALLAAAPALAEDSRILVRHYDPSTVVSVPGKVGIQATIAFNDDEHIENVAVGDSAVWQVTPNKRANILFVKPVVARARTNMTVVTDQRTYLFDLVASPEAAPVYVLRFAYPPKPKPIVVPMKVAAAAPPPPSAAVPPSPAAAPPPAALNFAWVAKGDRRLLPQRTFDDGRSTYLSWHADAALPAILVRDDKGVEGPINYSQKGEFIVVDGVPGMLVLRAGKQMATLAPAARRAERSAAAAPVAVPPAAAAAAAAPAGDKLNYELEDEPAPARAATPPAARQTDARQAAARQTALAAPAADTAPRPWSRP